jgi:nucleoid-associated protein YgaU
MTSEAGGRTGLSGPAIGGLATGVGALVFAVIAFFGTGGDAPEPGPAPEDEAAQATPGTDTAEEAAETDEAVAEGAPEAAPEAEPEAAPDFAAPLFDQIRVAPDGATVIAGQAPAGSTVTLILDGEGIAEAQSSGAGDFAAILTLEPSAEPRIMSLLAVTPDGTEVPGGETVIIAPFGMAEDAAPEAVADASGAAGAEDDDAGAATADETGDAEEIAETTNPAAAPGPEAEAQETAEADATGAPAEATELAEALAEPATGAGADTPATEVATAEESGAAATDAETPVAETADAETPGAAPATEPAETAETETEAPPEPQAPAIVVAGSEGVRVVQGGAPQVQTDIRIDAITYTTEGEVAVSGRGASDRQVQVLLNNRPIQMGEIGPGGQWSLQLPDVDPGTYTLSVTQLSPGGAVESRVDTPFLREDPARVAASPMRVEEGVSVITVQPGFTLWGIAEANFGDGIAYVQIFQENRENIRDPDLIFPGQIFQLPDLPRSEDAP